MRTSTCISALVLFLSLAWAQVDLSGKTQYYTNGLTDAFHLVDVIIPPSYSYSPLSDTSICLLDGVCSSSIVGVYEITYATQGSSIACLCNDAVITLDYMAENIGRVPLTVRETVTSYTAASNGMGVGAYTIGGKIAFFDPLENTEVFIHESAHAFDGANGGLSSFSVYYADETADTCVPDSYAATNDVENFAQLTVTWTYLVLTGNPVPSCLSNTLGYLNSVLPASSILATTCSTYSTSCPYPTSSSSSSSSSTSTTSASTTSSTGCTISVSQALISSWVTNGQTYSQYSVTFTNFGTQATDVAVQLGTSPYQIWNLDYVASNGLYHIPSYLPSGLEPGAQFQWGYIVIASSPIAISIVTPSQCA